MAMSAMLRAALVLRASRSETIQQHVITAGTKVPNLAEPHYRQFW
jgi:hypothetical protein